MPSTRVPLFVVRDGRVVRRTGPREWVPLGSPDESVEAIKRASTPEGLVYVWDADGVEAGAANHGFYQRLERRNVLFWADPGCRTPEDAMDAYFAGAQALTIRLDRMRPDRLSDFADLAEGEFHLGVSFEPAKPPQAGLAWDLPKWVGELHANGVVLEVPSAEALPRAQELARQLRSHGLTVSMLFFQSSKAFAAASADQIILPVERVP